METEIHMLILTLMFPSFAMLLILPIGNTLFLLHTKYQTLSVKCARSYGH